MIPKKIHYTWFSGEQMPQEVLDCIESWKKILPDYELRLWDMDSIKNIDSVFLKEALAVHKWAYVADFVRLYALYHEGGIYLDTDVVVFKRYDEFLKHKCFIGREDSIRFENHGGVQYLSSHCMGAEKGHKFIGDCLEYYKERHFVLSSNENLPTLLRYNYVLIPYIQAVIALDYGYDWNPRKERQTQYCKEDLVIYPSDYFCGLPFLKSSYCQHLTLGSWREHYKYKKYEITWKQILKKRISRIIRLLLLKNSFVLLKITSK